MPQRVAEAPSAELIAAAEQAKLTGQIRGFLSWLGEGRRLTQTGRIGLADARHLVELLDTGDIVDERIGNRVFRTRSSTELGNLTLIADWVKAASLARPVHGKLVPVQKNAKLAGKPLDLVMALLSAYPKLGKFLFPGDWRPSLVGDEFTDVSAELFIALLRGTGPRPLGYFSNLAYEVIDARYLLCRLTAEQLDGVRQAIKVDIAEAMSALDMLGVVVLNRNSDDADQSGIADWSKATVELTGLGRYAIRRVKGMAQPGDSVLRLRITLLEVSDPSVWREVIIPASYTLDRVHRVIQDAMGWQDCHLHDFRIGDREYGMPDPDYGFDTLDERTFRLRGLVKPGDVIEYRYDFGDNWRHELIIEAAEEAAADVVYPACTAGAGACPPEDSGGTGGFADLKAILAGPPGQARKEMRAWAGEDYAPERFDLAAAVAAVAAV
jgi:hypothetical protein